MNDKTFWMRFRELAEEAKKRRINSITTKSKNVYLLKINRSKTEEENVVAVTTLHPNAEFTILKEYVLKSNELLPPFFNETEQTIPELIKRLGVIAKYNLQRAIKSYRKHLTMKKIMVWLNEKEVKS